MYATVKVPICGLHLGADAESGRTDEVLYGMTVKILDMEYGKWCFLETHYGYRGFARKTELCFAEAERWERAAKKIVYERHTCDVLAEPRIQSKTLITLPRGSVLSSASRSEENGFLQVALCGGEKGYVQRRALAPYDTKTVLADENALRKRLVSAARLYWGSQYRWGGKTPLGIDCSGFCSMVYLLNGILIWRDSTLKPGYPIHEIPYSNLKEGDLLYFPGHIALFLGNGRYIHSNMLQGGVGINSLEPAHSDYREELSKSLIGCGSFF